MKRGEIGRYEKTRIAGESVRSFAPYPLPPDPPVILDVPLQRALKAADAAITDLNQAFETSIDQQSQCGRLVHQEAITSSQIEGIHVSLNDLQGHEAGEQPNTELDDVAKVLNCAAALEHGLHRMDDGLPLSNRLIREAHAIGKRGISKQLGEFRTSQNWIGCTRPGNARFVPPLPNAVPDCMAALERFIQSSANPQICLQPVVNHQLAPNTEHDHPPRGGNEGGRGSRDKAPRNCPENRDISNTTTKLLAKMFSSHSSLLNNLS